MLEEEELRLLSANHKAKNLLNSNSGLVDRAKSSFTYERQWQVCGSK